MCIYYRVNPTSSLGLVKSKPLVGHDKVERLVCNEPAQQEVSIVVPPRANMAVQPARDLLFGLTRAHTFPSARRTPRPCSVCGSPRLCRRRERCLIMGRFGRWPLAWRKIWAVSMFDLAV